jgi:hypothetical protein
MSTSEVPLTMAPVVQKPSIKEQRQEKKLFVSATILQ